MEAKATTTAAVYTRVSTAEQGRDDKTSLATQRERCEAYCAAQGWGVAEAYEDAGYSGADPDRPALARLLADAAAGRFERVVFLKLDRLSRRARDLLNLSHRLDGLGVGLVSVQDVFDTGTASGRLYFTLLGAFAEWERDVIHERMTGGRHGAVAKHEKYLASTVPYGYERGADGRLRPHPEHARVVKRVFRWARDGQGVKAIARRLEREGVEPPRPANRASKWGWHHTTVYKMLTAERYVGRAFYRSYRWEDVEGRVSKRRGALVAETEMACPALVDAATFEAVRAGMEQRKRNSPRNTKHFYLLQHRVECGHCGARYMGKTQPTKAGGSSFYLCRRRATYGAKAGHEGVRWNWAAAALDAEVKRWLLRLVASPERALQRARVYVEAARAEAADAEEQRAALARRLAGAEREEQRLVELYLKERVDEPEYVRQQERLRAERAEVEAGLAEVGDGRLTRAEKADLVEEVLLDELLPGLRGLTPRVSEARLEAALARLGRGEPVGASLGEPGELPEHVTLAPADLDAGWRRLVEALVEKVTVNDDGTVTVEGVLPARSSGAPRHR